MRLASGLWLFLFASTHLANHALGLVSLAAMENVRLAFVAFWRLPPVEASLLAALLVHVALGLHRLWERRSLRLRPTEALQLALGLAIPLSLTGHVLATGWLHRCCGVIDSYALFLSLSWPGGALSQTILVLLVWVHGCIGVHRWLRLKPGYPRALPWLAAVAALLPALALAGFASGGRELAALEAARPDAWAALARQQPWAVESTFRHRAAGIPETWIVGGYLALLGTILVARTVRWAAARRRLVPITYPGGRVVTVPRGLSVLEASQLRGIPHASVCGGRGRCSTCRVRVGLGGDELPAASLAERRVLRRIGASADVRLACQIRPVSALTVTPLMPAAAGIGEVLQPMNPNLGTERAIAVLFADLRGFTLLSEGRLPYDTVFILNRYFAAMGAAIEAAGGRVDKFIGDGVMALFGLDQRPAEAARTALAAARAMALGLNALNEELKVELDQPLRMGIGIHLGPAILGSMGYGDSRSLTAVGDTVNVASRLEAATKEFGCQLVVSEAVAIAAGDGLLTADRRELDLRGRAGRIAVRLLADAVLLPADLRPLPPSPSAWRRLLGRPDP